MSVRITDTNYNIPDDLKVFDVWCVWNQEIKQVLAPWRTGHLFPVKWGEGIIDDDAYEYDERPETDYETASETCKFTPRALAETYSRTPATIPDEDGGYDEDDLIFPDLLPTIILPHNPPNPPILFVDLDDVRDSETGEITEEAWNIVEKLDAYCEVSSSGTGLHLFVRAELPEGGKFIGELEGRGHIELYDHGRVVGCTWQHIPETPEKVPYRQQEINELYDQHSEEDEDNERRNNRRETDRDGVVHFNTGDESPYYNITGIKRIADQGKFSTHRRGWQGPHPVHGGTKTPDSDSINFNVDPDNDQWNCFVDKHGGGGPLELIAVVEEVVDCRDPCKIHSDPLAMAETCLYARDEYGVSDDADPPYSALVGVAKKLDLVFEDGENEIMGELTYETARRAYDEMNPEDFN